jgi:hypothetical protein
MSISITNSLSTSTANASLAVDSTKNVEPLAVRGEFEDFFDQKNRLICQ